MTIPYALQIANKGVIQAITDNEPLKKGVNVVNGEITYEAVAKALDYPYMAVEVAMKRMSQKL